MRGVATLTLAADCLWGRSVCFFHFLPFFPGVYSSSPMVFGTGRLCPRILLAPETLNLN